MSLSTQKEANQLILMSPSEKKITVLLAGLFSLRMLGLFMLLPVLALYTHHYEGADKQLIGIALGCYGLTQALFQIPFGMLSDRIGRKPVLLLGLGLLGLGSLIAFRATTIQELILGRMLQGSGAIGSTLLAFVADSTREAVRSRAMAIIGITIAFSFGLAMVLGPLLEQHFGLQGVFGFAFIFALIGMILLMNLNIKTDIKSNYFKFNNTVINNNTQALPQSNQSNDSYSVLAQFHEVLINKNCQCLNMGILSLHALFSTCFLFIPDLISELFPEWTHQSWKIYLPVLIGSLLLMAPFVRSADKTQNLVSILLGSMMSLGLSILVLLLFKFKLSLILGLIIFFASFNILESLLPSFVSQLVPSHQRGTALGVYSTAQFLGIFLGGFIGGRIHQTSGLWGIGLWCMILVLLFIGAIGYVKRR